MKSLLASAQSDLDSEFVITETYKSGRGEGDPLRNYVMNDGADAWVINSKFDSFQKKHPYGGGYLYRGLNFDTAQHYLAFRRSIRNNKIRTGSMTSWSTEQSVAKTFAMHKQVYNPTAFVMSSYDNFQKSKERIMGFVGVILKIKVGPHVGIDLQSGGYGSEAEVLLKAGEYDLVEVIEEKRFKNLLKFADKDAIVLSWLKTNKTATDEVKYVMGNHYETLKKSTIDAVKAVAIKQVQKTLGVELHPEKPFIDSDGVGEKLQFKNQMRLSIGFHTSAGEVLSLHDQEDIMKHVNTKSFVAKLNRLAKTLDRRTKLTANNYAVKQTFGALRLSISNVPELQKYFSNVYNDFNNQFRGDFSKLDGRGRESSIKGLKDVLEILTSMS